MNETVLQGLYITVLGMGLVFAALGALLLVMVLLDRAFRPRPRPERARADAAPREEEDLAIVAAVGLVLAQAAARAQASAPEHAQAMLGPWAAAGRRRQLQQTWRRGGRTSFWLPGR